MSLCSRFPSKHGYWGGAGFKIARYPDGNVAHLIAEEFAFQAEGWYRRLIEAGDQGVLVGTGRRRHCLICGAPTIGMLG